jgi:hypothetical protein
MPDPATPDPLDTAQNGRFHGNHPETKFRQNHWLNLSNLIDRARQP